jgi:mitochondrial import inner membrane translocase subunit TIM21
LVAQEEEFSAITDKIPQRPVSVVEGTSYTLVIVAALGFAAAVIYAALNELLFSPKEYQAFNAALSRVQDDPRVGVRLGSPLSAYGTESRNRAARQRIPHRLYVDAEGREHVQLQFHLKGPAGRATVNADMYKDGGQWRYNFLYLDVESPVPQQVVLVRPGQVSDY